MITASVEVCGIKEMLISTRFFFDLGARQEPATASRSSTIIASSQYHSFMETPPLAAVSAACGWYSGTLSPEKGYGHPGGMSQPAVRLTNRHSIWGTYRDWPPAALPLEVLRECLPITWLDPGNIRAYTSYLWGFQPGCQASNRLG